MCDHQLAVCEYLVLQLHDTPFPFPYSQLIFANLLFFRCANIYALLASTHYRYRLAAACLPRLPWLVRLPWLIRLVGLLFGLSGLPMMGEA